jgi:TPR repeat protein
MEETVRSLQELVGRKRYSDSLHLCTKLCALRPDDGYLLFVLGHHFHFGLGVKSDREKAKHLYRQSIIKGDGNAYASLAQIAIDEGLIVDALSYAKLAGFGEDGTTEFIFYGFDNSISDSDRYEMLERAVKLGHIGAIRQFSLDAITRRNNFGRLKGLKLSMWGMFQYLKAMRNTHPRE